MEPVLADALADELADALAYLGVPAGAPDVGLLRALVAAYTRRVPWESASRIARRLHTLDTALCPRWPAEFWQEAAQRGSGGTCFESNYAFFDLLRSLGYQGYLTINDMQEAQACHTAIILEIDGGRWLADVGLPLYAPLSIDPERSTHTDSPFHTYRLTPEGNDHYTVRRDRHPKPYAYTLIDIPVDEAAYRHATIADYGSEGHFLDRVIITRVVDGHAWRFNAAEMPLHLEQFVDGRRTDHPLQGDIAPILAARFGMDEETLRLALKETCQAP
jgi:arylamine N-acetyltransferase